MSLAVLPVNKKKHIASEVWKVTSSQKNEIGGCFGITAGDNISLGTNVTFSFVDGVTDLSEKLEGISNSSASFASRIASKLPSTLSSQGT